MKKIAFITRHTPNAEQKEICAKRGAELVAVGDIDGFDIEAVKVLFRTTVSSGCRDFAVVNPAVALNLAKHADEIGIRIWVFENANRAPEGETPAFFTKSVSVWEIFGDSSFGIFNR